MKSKQHLFIVFLFGLVLFSVSCAKQVYPADVDTSYYRLNYKYKADSDIDKMIAPYKKQLDSKMNEVIAYNKKEISKARPSSELGNWFGDILLAQANKLYEEEADFAVQNYGGIRVPSMKQGDITVGNIYELMPFDNQLVLLTMDGPTTLKLLNRIAEYGGWPISHTLSFTIDNNTATKIMIKGEPFDIEKSYTVALADYIANGGDRCDFLADAKRYDKDILIRDILINGLRAQTEEIVADPTPRIATYKM